MKLFLDQFEENRKQSPSRAAIVDLEGTRTTSYEELDQLSGRIAAALLAGGVKRGDFVAVMLPRKMEYLSLIHI